VRLCVKLFAVARQLAGAEEVEVEVPPGATVAQLRDALGTQQPALRETLNVVVFAVNSAYADERTPLSEDDEIACIPPVSGG